MENTVVRTWTQKSSGWSIALSVLLIVMGLIALLLPLLAGVAVAAVMSWLLIFAGMAHIVMAWHVRGVGAHIWEFLVGLAYILAGTYALMHPLVGLAGLTLVLSVYLFFKGVLETILGFSVRGAGATGWLLVDAAVSIFLAGMIWWHLPSASVWVVGTLVGVAMLFSGISRLAWSASGRRSLATL